jgi:hypothetical protein
VGGYIGPLIYIVFFCLAVTVQMSIIKLNKKGAWLYMPGAYLLFSVIMTIIYPEDAVGNLVVGNVPTAVLLLMYYFAGPGKKRLRRRFKHRNKDAEDITNK